MRFVATPVLVLLCAGCGERPPVAPVSGTITVDGQPLVGAAITTQPIAKDSRNPGAGSFGRTDEDGHFELELVKPAIKGAIIGEHRVMISPAGGEAASREPKKSADGTYVFWTDDPQGHRQGLTEQNLPPSFADGSLRMQVPPDGTDALRFDLKR